MEIVDKQSDCNYSERIKIIKENKVKQNTEIFLKSV